MPQREAANVICHSAVESAGRFDRMTRRYLDMSASEFLRRYDAGEYSDVNPDDIDGMGRILIAMPQR